jgi:meiotic recombination protein SPO11
VIRRIEGLVWVCVQALDEGRVPVLQSPPSFAAEAPGEGESEDEGGGESGNNVSATRITATRQKTAAMISKRLTLSQARSYTSLLLVASFCHQLLLSRRTTTIREVYYAHVTHFRSQRECDASIRQLCAVLRAPRHSLGLRASPRGWFCGDVQLLDPSTGGVVLDGRSHPAAHGHAVASDWLGGGGATRAAARARRRPYRLQTRRASCVLVVEKEGVYQRLVEDGFCASRPCVLVTSRGFPDLATRAFVAALHDDLDLPVLGLADCNPFGVSVLNTFLLGDGGDGRGGRPRRQQQQRRDDATDGDDSDGDCDGLPAPAARQGLCVHWMGLRPSQVEAIRKDLPPAVFQALTPLDIKRLNSLRSGSSPWLNALPDDGEDDAGDIRRRQRRDLREHELRRMLELGYKVELEALHWLGMDYLSGFVGRVLDRYLEKRQEHRERQSESHRVPPSAGVLVSYGRVEYGDEQEEDEKDDGDLSVNAWLDTI